jgi:hypothetical protein
MGISVRLADAILSTPSWFVRVISEREKYEWQVMGIERVQEEKLVNQFSRDKKIQRAKVLEIMRANYDSCLNDARALISTLFECLEQVHTKQQIK